MATGRGYERKGDPFTLKVLRGEGPPSVRHWRKNSTGREYFTRVCAHECYRLDAVTVAQSLREHAQRYAAKYGQETTAQELAQRLAFDWHPEGGTCAARLIERPKELRAEVRLRVEVTETGPHGARGARVWLTCPRCSRRVNAVYGSRWGADGSRLLNALTGCPECLGFDSYGSRVWTLPEYASLLTPPWKQKRDALAPVTLGEVMASHGFKNNWLERAWNTSKLQEWQM